MWSQDSTATSENAAHTALNPLPFSSSPKLAPPILTCKPCPYHTPHPSHTLPHPQTHSPPLTHTPHPSPTLPTPLTHLHGQVFTRLHAQVYAKSIADEEVHHPLQGVKNTPWTQSVGQVHMYIHTYIQLKNNAVGVFWQKVIQSEEIDLNQNYTKWCTYTFDFVPMKSVCTCIYCIPCYVCVHVHMLVSAVAAAVPQLTWSHQHSPKLGSCVSRVYSANSNPALMMLSSQTSRMMRACSPREGKGGEEGVGILRYIGGWWRG